MNVLNSRQSKSLWNLFSILYFLCIAVCLNVSQNWANFSSNKYFIQVFAYSRFFIGFHSNGKWVLQIHLGNEFMSKKIFILSYLFHHIHYTYCFSYANFFSLYLFLTLTKNLLLYSMQNFDFDVCLFVFYYINRRYNSNIFYNWALKSFDSFYLIFCFVFFCSTRLFNKVFLGYLGIFSFLISSRLMCAWLQQKVNFRKYFHLHFMYIRIKWW